MISQIFKANILHKKTSHMSSTCKIWKELIINWNPWMKMASKILRAAWTLNNQPKRDHQRKTNTWTTMMTLSTKTNTDSNSKSSNSKTNTTRQFRTSTTSTTMTLVRTHSTHQWTLENFKTQSTLGNLLNSRTNQNLQIISNRSLGKMAFCPINKKYPPRLITTVDLETSQPLFWMNSLLGKALNLMCW